MCDHDWSELSPIEHTVNHKTPVNWFAFLEEQYLVIELRVDYKFLPFRAGLSSGIVRKWQRMSLSAASAGESADLANRCDGSVSVSDRAAPPQCGRLCGKFAAKVRNFRSVWGRGRCGERICRYVPVHRSQGMTESRQRMTSSTAGASWCTNS